MGELSLSDFLVIVGIFLGPGIVLFWRFLLNPPAPYRRSVEELMAAQSSAEALSSLGDVREARLGVRQAEMRILGRVAFNRQVRRRPHAVYLALSAWGFLVGGVAAGVVAPGTVAGWVSLALMSVGIVLGTVAALGVRKLTAAARPVTLRAYSELCRSRIVGCGNPPLRITPDGSAGSPG